MMATEASDILFGTPTPVTSRVNLAVMTGVVEAMVVDYQCIFPSIVDVAACHHTLVISTSEKGKFPGATHMEFTPHDAMDVARNINVLVAQSIFWQR